jgi:formylglycine-generating enzyme required for sulfatase activity
MCPSLVVIPAGIAKVGSPENEAGRLGVERAVTDVPIERPFAIGRLEVLRDEFAAFVKETGYQAAGDCYVGAKARKKYNWQSPGFEQDGRHPVVCVNWMDAATYVTWLKKKTGRNYRLLKEVEWEYAARAGTTTPYWQGEELATSHANFGRSRDGTIPGGSLQSNKFGVADVSGNAWEMIAECDEGSLGRLPGDPGAGAVAPPPGQNACVGRMIKGGGWNSSIGLLRHAVRAGISEEWASNAVGFRVARDLDANDSDKILTREEKAAIQAADKAAADLEAKAAAEAEKAERERVEAEIKAQAAAAAAPKGKK